MRLHPKMYMNKANYMNFESKTHLFLFQFQHPNPSSQNMAGPETSTNVTVQLEVNYLAWIPEKINWTSVETAVCASSSEMVVIWIIFSIEFVVMCLALFGLCCLLRSNHAVPLFVMNLFYVISSRFVSSLFWIFVHWLNKRMYFCLYFVFISWA